MKVPGKTGQYCRTNGSDWSFQNGFAEFRRLFVQWYPPILFTDPALQNIAQVPGEAGQFLHRRMCEKEWEINPYRVLRGAESWPAPFPTLASDQGEASAWGLIRYGPP